MKKVKQVIVWRNDLKVRKGKYGSQIAHASGKAIFDLMSKGLLSIASISDKGCSPAHEYWTLSFKDREAMGMWLNGQFTKIVLQVNSEQELREIHDRAKEAGLITSFIIDSGKTEFNGIPTPTCCAIGPNWSEDIDKITGHLKLM
jgi:PTH2 family peptidyl-tRNA hydrolase